MKLLVRALDWVRGNTNSENPVPAHGRGIDPDPSSLGSVPIETHAPSTVDIYDAVKSLHGFLSEHPYRKFRLCRCRVDSTEKITRKMLKDGASKLQPVWTGEGIKCHLMEESLNGWADQRFPTLIEKNKGKSFTPEHEEGYQTIFVVLW